MPQPTSSQGTTMQYMNGVYIGPEINVKRKNKYLRYLASVWYLLTTLLFSLVLLVIQALIRGLEWLFGPIPRSDQICTFLHSGAAGCINVSNQLFISMIYPPGSSYPIVSDMTIQCHPSLKDTTEADAWLSYHKLRSLRHPTNIMRSLIGLQPYFIPGRCFIMCNHVSNADGIILRGESWPMSSQMIYKKSLEKLWVVSHNLRLSRDIAVPFTSNKDGWAVEDGFKQYMHSRLDEIMDNNQVVLAFPEGTRCRFGRMSPFRHGLFQYCIENKIPIRAIALYGTNTIVPTTDSLINPGYCTVMHDHTMIWPDGHTVESLVDEVRRAILRLLIKHIPEFDPEAEQPIETIEEFDRIRQASGIIKK